MSTAKYHFSGVLHHYVSPKLATTSIRIKSANPELDWPCCIRNCEGRKVGRNWVLCRFQQLRSYHDEIETWNREEIPYSLRIVPRGILVAEGP